MGSIWEDFNRFFFGPFLAKLINLTKLLSPQPALTGTDWIPSSQPQCADATLHSNKGHKLSHFASRISITFGLRQCCLGQDHVYMPPLQLTVWHRLWGFLSPHPQTLRGYYNFFSTPYKSIVCIMRPTCFNGFRYLPVSIAHPACPSRQDYITQRMATAGGGGSPERSATYYHHAETVAVPPGPKASSPSKERKVCL